MPDTVSVGCKIPNGLMLQLYRVETYDEQLMAGGTRKAKRAIPEGLPVKLNGCARRVGKDMPHQILMGAGITHGVDADFFNEWVRRNADSDVVKKGLVFSQTKPGEIEAQVKDHRTLKSGMEPIDPRNLPAEFKHKIETADAA